MNAPATFHALVEGTAPPIPAHLLLGIIHANLAFAIPKLSGHPMALAALDSALDMIREHNPMLDQALSPELRPAHMAEWDSPPSARVVAGGSKRAGRPCGNESATPVGEL